VLNRWELLLHYFVATVYEAGCHVSHTSPVTIKLEQVLKINVALSWYLNIPTLLDCYFVIPYVNTSKMYAAA
jgi:hypothetical protein